MPGSFIKYNKDVDGSLGSPRSRKISPEVSPTNLNINNTFSI